jgi:phage shock protein E
MNILRKTICLALFAAWATLASAAEPTKDSLETVKKNVDDEKAVLVDVRDKSEWDEGHLEGAISLPLSELSKAADATELTKRLPKETILYTYCVAGKRSLKAAGILEGLGYNVRSLKPGYDQLIDFGFKKAE